MPKLLAPSTWAARPVSADVGDLIQITNVGNAMFHWSGTRWVTSCDQDLAVSGAALPVHTGTTARTTLASVTLLGGLLGPNGYLMFDCRTSSTGASAKLVQVSVGGTDFFHFGPTSAYIGGEMSMMNRGSEAIQVGNPINLASIVGNGTNTLLTGTVNTAIDRTINIDITLANAADTFTMQAYRLYFLSGA